MDTVEYSGTISSRNGQLARLAVPDGVIPVAGPLAIKITFQVDPRGQEAVQYRFNDRLFETLFLNSDGEYESSNGITLRPPEQLASLPSLGFLLPPGQSKLLSPSEWKRNSANPIDACPSGQGECRNVDVEIAYSGAFFCARWLPHEESLQISLGGAVIAKWSLSGNVRGYPASVKFDEYDRSGHLMEHAEYRQTGFKSDGHDLAKADLLPHTDHILVMRGLVGYGYSAHAKAKPWDFYRGQEQVWGALQKREKPQVLLWIPIAVASVFAIVFLVFMARRAVLQGGRRKS